MEICQENTLQFKELNKHDTHDDNVHQDVKYYQQFNQN